MRSIPVGAKGSFVLVVTTDHLANRFKDAMLPPVLATPIMIMMMENAALNAIKPYLEANESALGTRVDVRHLAATPAGRSVTANAEVTGVDGRHIEFQDFGPTHAAVASGHRPPVRQDGASGRPQALSDGQRRLAKALRDLNAAIQEAGWQVELEL